MSDTLATAVAWQSEGRVLALATVAETWGSAPRPVGSHLVIDSAGNFEGSVSGGCVEGAVIAEALEMFAAGGPLRFLSFGVADETAWRVGLSCGGRISVLLQRISTPAAAAALVRMSGLARKRQAAALVSDLGTGDMTVVASGETDHHHGAIQQAILGGRSALVEADGHRVLVAAHTPSPRLVLVGAVHIAQALAPMAVLAGYEVVIVDPRSAFATLARFDGAEVLAEWPEDVLDARRIDGFTAVAALTHDPKIDDRALQIALQARCFYVGALGSRKTHARRLERLAAAGVPADRLSAIRAPIGLAIGAVSPPEIAVAILAEIIASLRSAEAQARAA